MKTKLIVALMVFTIAVSQVAFTSERSIPEDSPSPVAMAPASADDAHVLEDLVAITPTIPLGPRDLLQGYESEMASIADRLSTELGAITNAVGGSRSRGEHLPLSLEAGSKATVQNLRIIYITTHEEDPRQNKTQAL
jgi:hypothetical protein